MDPIVIPALVASAWTVLQPYLPLIAAKAAEKVGEGLPTAVGKAWKAIKQKFDTKAAAKEALEELLKDPANADAVGAFRLQLKKALEEDDTFASNLAKLLAAAGATYKAELHGAGAIAMGPGAKAVGKGGILIEGDVDGSTLVTGNSNSVSGRKQENDR
jgi:hypothetical protein